MYMGVIYYESDWIDSYDAQHTMCIRHGCLFFLHHSLSRDTLTTWATHRIYQHVHKK
jgi:hypothetical protein